MSELYTFVAFCGGLEWKPYCMMYASVLVPVDVWPKVLVFSIRIVQCMCMCLLLLASFGAQVKSSQKDTCDKLMDVLLGIVVSLLND